MISPAESASEEAKFIVTPDIAETTGTEEI